VECRVHSVALGPASLHSLFDFLTMAFTNDKELLELIDASVEDQSKALEMLKAKPDLLARRNRLNETALHFLVVEDYPQGVEFLCSERVLANRWRSALNN